MSGIYLHIPFCKQACSYCDFYFVTRTSEREHFVNSLTEEIRSWTDTPYAREPVQSVYFGGGTPSLLAPEQVEHILEALREVFHFQPEEVTLEMNPDDIGADYLKSLNEIGISRASMGVQTFNPDLLRFMNRAHSREEALQCMELLSQSGFKSFTVDLIYGNPDQSLNELESDLNELLAFTPPHVSAYSLTIEPETRLGKQVDLGRIIPSEDDLVADQFDLIAKRLGEQNIHRYEVSNYSKPGHEALHNSNYWQHHNYIGMGPGAHSFWWGDKAQRWINKPDLRQYLKADRNEIRDEVEELSPTELAEERIMMGLRTRSGLAREEMSQRYRYELGDRQHQYLEQKHHEGFLTYDDHIVLTPKGIKIADTIILDLITLH